VIKSGGGIRVVVNGTLSAKQSKKLGHYPWTKSPCVTRSIRAETHQITIYQKKSINPTDIAATSPGEVGPGPFHGTRLLTTEVESDCTTP